MKESEIEKYFIWKVACMGGKTYKFKSVNCRGVSDRVAMLPDGSTWFVELKTKTGKLSKLQEIFMNTCCELNQKYAVFHSTEEINKWGYTYGKAVV